DPEVTLLPIYSDSSNPLLILGIPGDTLEAGGGVPHRPPVECVFGLGGNPQVGAAIVKGVPIDVVHFHPGISDAKDEAMPVRILFGSVPAAMHVDGPPRIGAPGPSCVPCEVSDEVVVLRINECKPSWVCPTPERNNQSPCVGVNLHVPCCLWCWGYGIMIHSGSLA